MSICTGSNIWGSVMFGLMADSEIHSSSWENKVKKWREREAQVKYTQLQLWEKMYLIQFEREFPLIWPLVKPENMEAQHFLVKQYKIFNIIKARQVYGTDHPLTRLLKNVWITCESLNRNPYMHKTCQYSQKRNKTVLCSTYTCPETLKVTHFNISYLI